MKTSQDAAMSMKELVDEEGGTIRMTAPSSLADWFAPELIKEFKEKLPNIKVEIESSNVKRDLINDGYDFALRAMDETNPDLIARYIGHIKDVIVASPEYVKKMKLKGVDPQELKSVPVIMSSLKESWNTQVQQSDHLVATLISSQMISSAHIQISQMQVCQKRY